MSSQDNHGLRHPSGNVFPSEDDLPNVDQGERMLSSSSTGGTGNHASPTLPPPPPVTLPKSCLLQIEKYEINQALLACKHQDGKSICAHVLIMKSLIDKLGMLGVIFPREIAIDLVLVSLPESYSQLIKEYYMRDRDATLIELTYMLIDAKA